MRPVARLFFVHFGLVLVCHAQALSPQQAMRQAAIRLPSVQAAQALLESAQAYARSIGAQPNPYLRLSATAGDTIEESNALVFPFEIGGQPGLRQQAAESEALSRERELASERRLVALRTGQSYYTAWEKRGSLRAARSRTALARELEFSTLRRYQVGEISQNTHLRAELELARAQSDEVTALAEEEQAVGLLKLLLGKELDEPVELSIDGDLPQPPSLPLVIPPNDSPGRPEPAKSTSGSPSPLQTLQQGSVHLPEIEALRHDAQSLRSQTDLARSAMSPGLQLQFYRDRFFNMTTQGIQLAVTIPLWDWGQVNAEVERREGLVRAAEARVLDRELMVKQRLLEAYKRYQGAQARKGILREQVVRFSKLANDARRAYDANLMTLLEVFDVQQAYRLALQTYISAEAEVARATLELGALSPGGFFEEVTRVP